MKVVKNASFGGFGLSVEAQKRYLAKKGKVPYFYQQTKYKHRDGVEEYTRVENPDSMFYYVFTRDLGPVLNEFPNKESSYFYDKDIPRDDKDLVAVVVEMGAGANGNYAYLKVIEIPDGTEYEIDEYDGCETIREKHRSW